MKNVIALLTCLLLCLPLDACAAPAESPTQAATETAAPTERQSDLYLPQTESPLQITEASVVYFFYSEDGYGVLELMVRLTGVEEDPDGQALLVPAEALSHGTLDQLTGVAVCSAALSDAQGGRLVMDGFSALHGAYQVRFYDGTGTEIGVLSDIQIP